MGILALLFCIVIVCACAFWGLVFGGPGGASVGFISGVFVFGVIALCLQWRAEK